MSKLLLEKGVSKKRIAASRDDLVESSSVPIAKKVKGVEQTKVVAIKGKTGAKGKGKKQQVSTSDIVYLGHISHGFYEKEMRKFFSQFGKVMRIKLFRSKKTNNSKGYAFIQFEDGETADTVAGAMNGYMLHERQLVCHVVQPDKIHEGMFLKTLRKGKGKGKEGEEEDGEEDGEEELTGDAAMGQAKSFVRAQKKKQAKLEALGIDFQLLLPAK